MKERRSKQTGMQVHVSRGSDVRARVRFKKTRESGEQKKRWKEESPLKVTVNSNGLKAKTT